MENSTLNGGDRWQRIICLSRKFTQPRAYARIAILLCALAITGLATIPPVAAQDNFVAAKVNGVAIFQSRIDFLVKNTGQPDTPELRTRMKDELITREVLAQEAAKIGIDKTPEFAMQIELQSQGILVNAYLQDYMKTHPVDEDSMKKEYNDAKALSGDTEYKARHILVDEEAQAKQIIGRLKKGGKFEKIVAEKSKDTGSKGSGGDLGWSPANRFVPPFAAALSKLKKGQITDVPVQTQFGWHVIKLDDKRALKFPSFEDVKLQIQQQIQQEAVQKAIADLRAKARVE